jgi:sugar lactone lactonase YvrE
MDAPRSIAAILVLSAATTAIVSACGGDETRTPTTSSSATSAASTGMAGSTSSSGVGGSGGDGGQGGGQGGGGQGGAGGQGGGAGGGSADCSNIPAGPFNPMLAIDVFSGSEDIAFDGKGSIAGKNQQEIILAEAMANTIVIAMNVPTAYGLRYRPDGFLVVALPQANKIVEVSPQGMVTDLVTGLDGPNGIYPDFDGNVWFTELPADRVSRINPDKSVDVIVQGQPANGANGVVYDAKRKLLFYTNYNAGRIRSVDMSGAMPGAPQDVVEIQNASLDGLVMDACGHIYVVDQGNSRLYRMQLDAAGAPMGQPELLADFPQNVANAQFGSGPGWDSMTLYAAGNPGAVFAVPIGVPGAPVPTP